MVGNEQQKGHKKLICVRIFARDLGALETGFLFVIVALYR